MAVTITNDAATTRTNLGLGDAATKTVGTASGNIPVLDVSGKLESGRMPTLKTVGGSSIIGSGDIATLPSGGTANQVLTSDASSNATWADAAAGGKVLQAITAWESNTRTYYGNNRGIIVASENWVTPSSGYFGAHITKISSTSALVIHYSIVAKDFYQCHQAAMWRTTGGSPTTGLSHFRRLGFDGSRNNSSGGMIVSGIHRYTGLASGSNQFWLGLGRSNDGASTGFRLNPDTNDHSDTSGTPYSQIVIYEIEV